MPPILRPELNGVTVRRFAIEPEIIASAREQYASQEGRKVFREVTVVDNKLPPGLRSLASALVAHTEFHENDLFNLTVLSRAGGTKVAPHIDLSVDERFLVEGDTSEWCFGGPLQQKFGRRMVLNRGDVLRLNNRDGSLSPLAVRHGLKIPNSPRIRVGFLFCFNQSL